VVDGIQPVELLTVQEVADVLRVSTMTVYRLLKSGALPALRVGKGYRIRPTDLQSYLDRSQA
jgi:excisionase family DNA binding protein